MHLLWPGSDPCILMKSFASPRRETATCDTVRLVWKSSRILAVCQMLNTEPLNLYKLGTRSKEKLILVFLAKSLNRLKQGFTVHFGC